MVGPQTSLNVRVSVGDEVHGATTSQLNTVVGVVAVVVRAEVLKLEASRNVDVGVTVALVLVPVVGRHTVVEVWAAVGRTGHGRLCVGDFGQALVEGFPCVIRGTGRDAEVRGRRHVSWVVVEAGR